MNPLTHAGAERSMEAMNAWEPIAAGDTAVCAEAFDLRRPQADGAPPPTPRSGPADA